MNLNDVQTELGAMGLYTGDLDGRYGPRTDGAVEALLATNRVAGYAAWPDSRQLIAAQQVLARLRNIEVGGIDGRVGPMSLHAFEVYDARKKNGWKAVPEVEEWRGASDETTPPIAPSHPLPAPLATTVPHVASPRQSGVPAFYGAVGANQTSLTLPFPMRLAWDTESIVRKYSCHEKVREAMECVWKSALDHYGLAEIQRLRLDLFGGCLNVRKMRGGTAWSMHSWGIACDIDPDHNQLKFKRAQATLDGPEYDAFWAVVYATGAISLGRERDYDWMHFQYANL